MEIGNKDEQWELLDVEKLSRYMADDSFRARTKDVPKEDLYPVELNDSGSDMKVEKVLASKWSTLWFNLRDTWKEFLLTFKKEDHEENT